MLSGISVEDEAVAACTLMVENRRTSTDLTLVEPATNQAQIEDLVTANHEPTDTVCTLQKDMFDYLKRSSHLN